MDLERHTGDIQHTSVQKLFIKVTYYVPSVIPDVGNRIVKKALNLMELIKYVHKYM